MHKPGKPMVQSDVLQRQQLSARYAAGHQSGCPVICAWHQADGDQVLAPGLRPGAGFGK